VLNVEKRCFEGADMAQCVKGEDFLYHHFRVLPPEERTGTASSNGPLSKKTKTTSMLHTVLKVRLQLHVLAR